MSTPTSVYRQIGSLIADLSSSKGMVRQRARESLVSIGKPAVSSLIALLADPSRQTRWEAAKALSKIADPAAAPALVKAMKDETWSGIRWLAAEGLISMGRDGLEPLLETLIHHSDSTWLREGAHHVLTVLIKKKVLSDLLSPMLTALEHVEPTVAVPPAAQLALERLAARTEQRERQLA